MQLKYSLILLSAADVDGWLGGNFPTRVVTLNKTTLYSLTIRGTETLLATTVELETATDKSVTFTAPDAGNSYCYTPKQGKSVQLSDAGTATITATTARQIGLRSSVVTVTAEYWGGGGK